MTSDAELVQRAAGGEREAAGQIYERYAPLVRAILLDATGSLAEANDLVQEVFLRALSRLGQLRRRERLGGWLIGIARRQGMEYRRQAGRRRQRFTPLVDQTPATADPVANEQVELLRQAIRALPERERLAVHIHYLCGEPVEVARQALGLSPSALYKLLERARRRLRAGVIQLEHRR
jgi:RNA polymerase sigma-70 factor (ECF subfamily)